MTPLLRKALAFIRRDFQIESSYKMSFVMNVVDSMMVPIFFYFLNQLVPRGESRYLDRYGGNFLSFHGDWPGFRPIFPSHVLGVYSYGSAKRPP
jgi:hypothetical protein